MTDPRPAIFFDRDGTLIEDEHYIADPARVRLRAGVAAALRRAADAGYAIIVVTNQSGIARGFLTEDDYRRVAARLDELLAADGAAPIEASYFCPHLPEVHGACDCRKPGPALYERAAAERGLDLARSAFIGDRLRDVLPAQRFGGFGILVPSADTPFADVQRAQDDFKVSTTLGAAVDRVLARG